MCLSLIFFEMAVAQPSIVVRSKERADELLVQRNDIESNNFSLQREVDTLKAQYDAAIHINASTSSRSHVTHVSAANEDASLNWIVLFRAQRPGSFERAHQS